MYSRIKNNPNIKKELLLLLVVLTLYYLNSIIYVEYQGIIISDTPIISLIFLLFHSILFLITNYILIPYFFYKKKYVLFLLILAFAVILFSIIEEGFLEKILTPDSKGLNDLTWQSIYWCSGEILVPLLSFMTIKFVFDNYSQQQKLDRIEQNRLKNELQLLKSQIQPHILFNSLNNLYHFALNKSDQVPKMIIKLSNVLRYVLYETAEEKVSLTKVLTFIKDYIGLQEIQYQGRGNIEYTISEEKDTKSLKIVPFILIPFIENSFKHSFGTKIKDVSIKIRITVDKEYLVLFIKNNFEKNNSEGDQLLHGGIGLKNVQKRLELLYHGKHEIKIEKGQDDYCINLRIKLD